MNRYVLLAAIVLGIMATGCRTVVRENIISSINTGVGATLAENPQTQLYEVKIGYIRSQFYSIPTGKMILEENSDRQTGQVGAGNQSVPIVSKYHQKTTNAANITPEVVSGIKVHSGAEHLFLGVDVSENFAVGNVAVNSKAATAMYITETKDAGVAAAASQAAASVSKIPTVSTPEAQSLISEIRDKYTTNTDKQAKIEEIVKANGYKSWNDFLDARDHDPATLIKILSEVKKL